MTMWTLILVLTCAGCGSVALPKTYGSYDLCMDAGEAAMHKQWHYSPVVFRQDWINDVGFTPAFKQYVCTGSTKLP